MGLLTYVSDEEGYIRTVGPQYLTYITYQALGGTLDEATFDNFEYEAETIINWYTFNRLKNEDPNKYPNELERCMYKLIELAKLEADAMALGSQTTTRTEGTSVVTVTTTAPISSQSNDGVSTSYNTIDASKIFDRLTSNENGNIIENTVKKYLQGVTNSLGRKLLYRGLYPGE